MSAKPAAIPRAPAVAAKLEAARDVLHTLERDVGQFVLDAAEGVPGAAKKLADFRTTIAAAQRDVGGLQAAHLLAAQFDRQASAAIAVEMRADQFRVMKQRADTRLKSAATLMETLATAAKAYHQYVVATNEMVIALPTGTRMGTIMMGRNGYAGNWVGDLKALIGAEAWRLVEVDEKGRMARLPFAMQPEINSTDHTKLPPGIEVLTQAQDSVLRDIEAQMHRLNSEAMAIAEGKAA